MSRPQHNSESELLEKRHIMKKQIIRATLTAFAVLALVAGSTALRAQQPKDIVDTAVAAGSFKTLAAALTAAGLIDTLKGDGPFTVFAPTDAAFAKLPAGTVEMLLKPENKAKLTAILTYHVVAGNVMAAKVVTMNGQEVKTVNGQSIKIMVSGGKVMVDGANVVTTDIKASNGVIHVIDSVILPK
jgi:transforming growth factor-beta-induced protein